MVRAVHRKQTCWVCKHVNASGHAQQFAALCVELCCAALFASACAQMLDCTAVSNFWGANGKVGGWQGSGLCRTA